MTTNIYRIDDYGGAGNGTASARAEAVPHISRAVPAPPNGPHMGKVSKLIQL
jgi:hypothetical protein